MFSVFYCFNSSRSNAISSHDILSSCKNILGPFDTFFERRSFISLGQTKETLSCLICIVFPFRELALQSVKTDIHCTAKCTCKYVLLDTNRQSTLRRNLLCLDNEI